jgi:hypothetical protein
MLRFNFSIAHGEIDRLMLNGHEIYPMDPRSVDFIDLTADQLIKSPEGTWNYAATPHLGWGLCHGCGVPDLSSSDQSEIQLKTVRVEILEIAGRFINGFPIMDIKLLQTPSGKLMIGDASIMENTVSLAQDQECTTILCKWRAIIADKVSKMKGCGGKRPGAVTVPMVKPMAKPSHHGHSRPRPAHGAHRPHRHHHHRHGGFARFLRSIVFHVFIPIMIGVVVGITASLVGMIVGHIVIFIWRILFRRGERAQYCRRQREERVSKDDDDESKGFLEHENPPPVYEDAPAYEETVVEKA